MDLRAEPIVLCVPEIEKDRYYSVQLVSQYTYNFGYIGSRATGNGAGCYAVAGPDWTGDAPAGIAKVFQSETEFALAIYRTQLFDPADMDKVKAIQAELQGRAAVGVPRSARPGGGAGGRVAEDRQGDGPRPTPSATSPSCSSSARRPGRRRSRHRCAQRFASIGIEAGKPFSAEGLSGEARAALEAGAKAGAAKVEARVKAWGEEVNGWRLAKDGFGDRATLGDDYVLRAAAAANGIFGNDAAEALYPLTRVDGEGAAARRIEANYTLTFPAGQLPPVNAFWSVTMYDGKTQLLVANPIDRYLVNSPMLPELTKDADGGVTLYIQKDRPSRPGAGGELAAGAGRPDLPGDASSTGRRRRRSTAAGRLRRSGGRARHIRLVITCVGEVVGAGLG